MTANSTIDTELGEVLQENEEQLAHDIAEQIAAKIRQGPLPGRRDAHPKAHGCVRAMFQVEKDLPPNLAQGVFVPGKSYLAWIRTKLRHELNNKTPRREPTARDPEMSSG
jgi:hypothetical protein